MRFICRHPQKRELDLSILKKEIVFQFEISPGNNPKWTFFRCVIPCACTIQIQNAIVIYISFKLLQKVSDVICKYFYQLLLGIQVNL